MAVLLATGRMEGYVVASGEQVTAGLLALAILYAWVPIALKLVAVAIMWNFPLDEAEQGRLRASIERPSEA